MVVQVPKFSVTGNKRKLLDKPTPDMLKKMKLDTESVSSHTPVSGRLPATAFHKATVDDAQDEDSAFNFAPGGDADYFVEEDNDGRFFGGGLSAEQKDILNIFDKAGSEGIDEVSSFVPILSHVPHWNR